MQFLYTKIPSIQKFPKRNLDYLYKSIDFLEKIRYNSSMKNDIKREWIPRDAMMPEKGE